MKPDLFITRQRARNVAQMAYDQGLAAFFKVQPVSRLAADRSRESGFAVVLFDHGQRFVGYAAAEG